MPTPATLSQDHKVVSQKEWLASRQELLRKEKEFTQLRDQLSAERRNLPWVKIDKNYEFDTVSGKKSLAELFEGRSQLIVYHFMLGPAWKEGCPSCSYLADHYDGAAVHLANRDVTLTVVSRAPLQEIQAYKQRMGWRFHWVSSHNSDFNYDFHVSFTPEEVARKRGFYNFREEEELHDELPGASVFYQNQAGEVFHTYSTYARGLDMLVGAYNFLDLTPKGRDEAGLPHSMAWVRRHDKYPDPYFEDAKPKSDQKQTGGHSCCSEPKS